MAVGYGQQTPAGKELVHLDFRNNVEFDDNGIVLFVEPDDLAVRGHKIAVPILTIQCEVASERVKDRLDQQCAAMS